MKEEENEEKMTESTPNGEASNEMLPLDKLKETVVAQYGDCLLYTSPSPRDAHESRMPSSA